MLIQHNDQVPEESGRSATLTTRTSTLHNYTSADTTKGKTKYLYTGMHPEFFL
jgi:hypothetical protein